MLDLNKKLFAAVFLLTYCFLGLGITSDYCAWADTLRCSVCHKAINGTYYESSSGKILCEKDYEKSVPKCSICGKKISGTYYRDSKNRILCAADYKAVQPKCSVCGKPIEGGYIKSSGGKILCKSDAVKLAHTCAFCGKKIMKGGFFTLREHRYLCEACNNLKLPRCFLCLMPVSAGGSRYSDGRYACKYHNQNTVNTQRELNPYLKRTLGLIAQHAGTKFRPNPEYCTLHIVDKNSLNGAMHNADDKWQILGLTKTTIKGGRMAFQICILQGLPAEYLDSTMIHELGHVWLRLNNKKLSSGASAHEEGFCEWLSYYVNKQMGRTEQVYNIEMRDDPIYGQGFKKYRAIEKKYGIKGVIKYALTPQY